MFERFTDRARRVVVLAQEEARLLNHNYIGTEHVLLGLVREGEGVAAEALTELGVGLDQVRAEVKDIIGLGGEQPQQGHIPFTPRAKKVLELSLRESLQLGHDYIGTEHILLGLVREGEGVAAQVLVKLGADLPRVRRQVVDLLQRSESEGRRPPEGQGERGPFGASAQAFGFRGQFATVLSRLGEVMTRLEDIGGRLAAIERRLAPGGTGTAGAAGETSAAAGETGTAGDTGTGGQTGPAQGPGTGGQARGSSEEEPPEALRGG